MSETVKKFKFVSPGVFINEIDNSQLPNAPARMGPLVIGRTARGPAMRPVIVSSFSEFIEIFGEPVAGGSGDDLWRNGNTIAPTYAAYAAQAYLTNNNPVSVIRLLGAHHSGRADAGNAGWATNLSPTAAKPTNGGAYGLFIVEKDTTVSGTANHTGSLAAVWYLNTGSVQLTGNARADNTASITAQGTAILIESAGVDKQFKVVVDKGGDSTKTYTFNFNRNSQKYIRKVFNTNPTLTNSNITTAANTESYWLGESYDRSLAQYVTSSTAGQQYGVILALVSGSDHHGNMNSEMASSKTGWFIGQDLVTVSGSGFQALSQQKLFRIVSQDTGRWNQDNLKISIENLKASQTPHTNKYGSFTLTIRSLRDTDNRLEVIERFSQCNLNPHSMDFVGKKIGDSHVVWSDTDKRYREYGNHPNLSKFVRVELNQDVDAGTINPEALPWGVYGPPRFNGFTILSGNSFPTDGAGMDRTVVAAASTLVAGADDIYAAGGARNESFGVADENFVSVGAAGGYYGSSGEPETSQKSAYTASFVFPALPLRASSKAGGLSNEKNAYFGVDLTRSGSSQRFDDSTLDQIRAFTDSIDAETDSKVGYQYLFTMDDLSASSNEPGAAVMYYDSGSHGAGTSVNALSGGYQSVLDRGFNKFTTVMFGGFDGLDVVEKEPFQKNQISGDELTSYEYYSIKRAIDTISDAEVVEFNVATIPGMRNSELTEHLINTCEDRGDALAIIDIDSGFETQYETNSTLTNRVGTVATAVNNLKTRELDSSYGCAYYPWVQIRDGINGAMVWVPPSVVALGVLGSAEAQSALWFAPAGFTRGGLSEGAAGLAVTNVRDKLTADNRDDLYEANINPIASFPAEGLVIFGQKTLQARSSALDRINIRRLMIFVKKEVSRMASRLLFDQNIQVTWDRFLSEVEPFLGSVKAGFGLVDFKVVLDKTTTTPDLIDRNIMYARVYLKPAKAIEFIALDFTITNQGAAFAD